MMHNDKMLFKSFVSWNTVRKLQSVDIKSRESKPLNWGKLDAGSSESESIDSFLTNFISSIASEIEDWRAFCSFLLISLKIEENN